MNIPARRFLVYTIATLAIIAGYAVAQTERKQIMASGGSWINPYVTALSIERGAKYPSVIRLKGDVEIKMKGIKIMADEAEFHEGTGEIEARGNVRILPYPATEGLPRPSGK